jgi:hypothetical protein
LVLGFALNIVLSKKLKIGSTKGAFFHALWQKLAKWLKI